MAQSDSTAQIAGHPIHPMLVGFPIAAFVGTLAADLAYLSTSNAFWFTASRWLLLAGLVTAVLAALAGLADFLFSSRVRNLNAAWLHAGGNVVVVALETWNYLARAQPGAIASPGVYLSLASVVILLVTGWLGGQLVYKHRVAVSD